MSRLGKIVRPSYLPEEYDQLLLYFSEGNETILSREFAIYKSRGWYQDQTGIYKYCWILEEATLIEPAVREMNIKHGLPLTLIDRKKVEEVLGSEEDPLTTFRQIIEVVSQYHFDDTPIYAPFHKLVQFGDPVYKI